MSDVCCTVGERLRIGDQVVIQVIAIGGKLAHLRISAPEPVVICRERSAHDPDDGTDFFHSE